MVGSFTVGERLRNVTEEHQSTKAASAERGRGRRHRIRDFLGLEHNVLVMVLAGSLQGLGTGLWNGYLSKVLQFLGASGVAIGAFGTVRGLIGTVSPYFGGVLSDRMGRGRALILASLLALAGFGIYLLAPTWWLFIPGAVLLRLAGSFKFMGSLALTADRLRENRRAVSIGAQNVIGRLPGIIAPPLGGLLIASSLGLLRGFRAAVAITLVLTVVAILIQRRHYRLPPPVKGEPVLHPLAALWAMKRELKGLLLADSLVRFGDRMFQMFVVLYVINVLGRGFVEYGSLMALAAATSVVLYIPVAKLADRAGQASRRPFVLATLLFTAAFPPALVLAPSAAWLVPLFILRGLREFGEPARKALILDLAPDAARGRQIGVYYMVRGIVMFPAPFLGGLLWDWNYIAPFLIGGIISGAGVLWFALEGVGLHRNADAEGARVHEEDAR